MRWVCAAPWWQPAVERALCGCLLAAPWLSRAPCHGCFPRPMSQRPARQEVGGIVFTTLLPDRNPAVRTRPFRSQHAAPYGG
jgi:hypothetical protein